MVDMATLDNKHSELKQQIEFFFLKFLELSPLTKAIDNSFQY